MRMDSAGAVCFGGFSDPPIGPAPSLVGTTRSCVLAPPGQCRSTLPISRFLARMSSDEAVRVAFSDEVDS